MKNPLLKIASVALLTLALTGCENMSHRERNTAYGAGIGAVGGAAISGLTGGNVATGALIGAGVGGVGGYLYDDGYSYDR
jgi:uncharacterized membrane protein